MSTASFRSWASGWLIIGLALLAYANSFRVPFLFDDVPSIAENAAIYPAPHWPDALGLDLPGGLTVSGRPGLNLSFALNTTLAGPGIVGFHVFNLLIHLGTGTLIWLVLGRALRRPPLPGWTREAAPWLATITSAWWLLHPLQTEAVTYIVQRAESLAALSIMAALFAFDRGLAATGRVATRWFVAAALINALGMTTKEVVAVAPLLFWAYDRTFYAGTWRSALRARPLPYLGLAGGWLVTVTLLTTTAGRGDTAGLNTTLTPWSYALTQVYAVPHYLRLIVWPTPLVFDYGQGTITDPAQLLGSGFVLTGLIAAVLVALRRQPVLGMAGLWWFLLLAPSSSIVPIATQTIAEHRAYLALLAPVTLLAAVVVRYATRIAIPLAIGVAVLLAGLTFLRNQTYASAATLWNDTVAKRPGNPRAYHNAALAHFAAGHFMDALAANRAALALAPDDPETHYNLGLTLARLNRGPEAITAYRASLAAEPTHTAAMNNLALALQRSGKLAEAETWLQRALDREPTSAEIWGNLSLVQFDRQQFSTAAASAERAVSLAPQRAEAHDQLGRSLAAAGQLSSASPSSAPSGLTRHRRKPTSTWPTPACSKTTSMRPSGTTKNPPNSPPRLLCHSAISPTSTPASVAAPKPCHDYRLTSASSPAIWTRKPFGASSLPASRLPIADVFRFRPATSPLFLARCVFSLPASAVSLAAPLPTLCSKPASTARSSDWTTSSALAAKETAPH